MLFWSMLRISPPIGVAIVLSTRRCLCSGVAVSMGISPILSDLPGVTQHMVNFFSGVRWFVLSELSLAPPIRPLTSSTFIHAASLSCGSAL